jgi:xylose isomerase-like TIM barrel protein
MRARLGINNCFAVKRWPRPDDWAQIVHEELGLDILELSVDLIEDTDSPAGRERAAGEIRSALGGHGLRAETMFTGLAAYSLNLLMHPDAARRRAAAAWYMRFVDLAAQAGARGVGGHGGAMSVPDWSDPARRAERWSGLRQSLAEIAAAARSAGLEHLLVENLASHREPSTIASLEFSAQRRRRRARAGPAVPGCRAPVRPRHDRGRPGSLCVARALRRAAGRGPAAAVRRRGRPALAVHARTERGRAR